MNTALELYKNISDPMAACEKLGNILAKSGALGVKTPEQGFLVAFNCMTTGMSIDEFDSKYHLIHGRKAMRAEAMHAGLLAEGGKVIFHESTDEICKATFSHPRHYPDGYTVVKEVSVMQKLGQLKNPTWKGYPKRMLQCRAIADGVRVVCPSITTGLYTREEIEQFDEPAQAETKVVERKPVEFVADAPPNEPQPKTKALPPARLQQTLDWFASKGLTIDAEELEVAVKGRYEEIKELYPPEQWTEEDWVAMSKWMQKLTVMDLDKAREEVRKACKLEVGADG